MTGTFRKRLPSNLYRKGQHRLRSEQGSAAYVAVVVAKGLSARSVIEFDEELRKVVLGLPLGWYQ
jgi:hypothetical protein